MLLNKIREPVKDQSIMLYVFDAALIFVFGILLGVFSKFLDEIPANYMPFLKETLDLANFLGEMSIWMLIAAMLAAFAKTPLQAAVRVLLFFSGMLFGYYAYTIIFAGFFPKSYIMIWIGFTAVSPVLAVFCWYAKGRGAVALVLSAAIIGVLFTQAFVFGLWYFNVRGIGLHALVWAAGVAVFYKNPKQLTAMLALSLIFVFIYRTLPFLSIVY